MLRDNQKLSPEGAHAIHQYTEKLNTDIERILGNSSSYFKLFLEIPTMYRLFRELKIKLGELATASHSVVFDNLSAINDEHLTKMLLVADQLEDNLGLFPGTLTTTLKDIFDTFYQGLLEPLGLHSQRHILLVTSMLPIEQRILAANKRAAQAVLEQNEVREKRQLLERLLTRINSYKEHHGADPCLLDSLRSIMIADFKRILPILDKERHHLSPDTPAGNEANQVVDGVLNDSNKDKPKLINIEALAAACSSYFQGLYASQQLILDTANEKIKYLAALKITQQGVNANFNEIYTKVSFKKQAAAIVIHHVGFIHCDMEYKHKLMAYLQEAEGAIVLAAKNITDIDQKIDELLQAKLKQFKLANDKDYCHLDKVLIAISRLKQYVIQSDIAIKAYNSLFESDETLRKKAFLVDTLDKFADDKALFVCERIKNIKEFVDGNVFKQVLLDYHCYDGFTFAWLKQCIISFLELIRLYTPERKQCYNQLVNSTGPLPEGIGQVSSHGLFSAKGKRAYPLPIIVTPVLA